VALVAAVESTLGFFQPEDQSTFMSKRQQGTPITRDIVDIIARVSQLNWPEHRLARFQRQEFDQNPGT